jgi:pimeloyl-ACP methyl ester carboxylesterase
MEARRYGQPKGVLEERHRKTPMDLRIRTREISPVKPRPLAFDAAGEGEPLVLLPGGITGWLSWIPHQERLSDRYRTIRVQPIHNELGSAGVKGDPGYTRDVAVESLLLTVDELGIERAHFAGWSAGGKGLLDFAISYPGRLLSMTLVEPAAEWVLEAAGETDREQESTDFLSALAGREVTDDDLARVLYAAGFVSDPAQARSDPYWEKAWPHRMALSWLSENLMGSDHTLKDLARVECPVLLTKGTETGKVERRVVDLLARNLPDARVVELEGTHAHHIESIDRFLEALDQHLRASPNL